MVLLTQAVFYGLPWLQWGERQAVLFDLDTRRFHLFGLVLAPQDFIFLSTLLVLCALGLFVVTAMAGRVWCGYACPQTVYSKLFVWVESICEGDRQRRLSLDKAPWTWNKIRRRGGKHLIWMLLALWTGLTFVGYFIPIRGLVADAGMAQWSIWPTFWTGFYAFATWGNAGFMREQVCKYMCPYARFQSAMFDRDTLIVSYDEVRGEPRGAASRKQASAGTGSCIDCSLCVQVCPVGIDIRNGLQYECIGCAACIDACDAVMDKIGQPRGLVRYTTANALKEGLSAAEAFARLYRPRVVVYGFLLSGIGLALVVGLIQRPVLRADIVRDRGVIARDAGEGAIENVYKVQLMSTLEKPQRVAIRVAKPTGVSVVSETVVDVDAAQNRWVVLTLRAEPGALQPGHHKVDVTFTTEREEVSETTRFTMPR
jgi:cytochrome c oxidase accessory protein FixG